MMSGQFDHCSMVRRMEVSYKAQVSIVLNLYLAGRYTWYFIIVYLLLCCSFTLPVVFSNWPVDMSPGGGRGIYIG